jgi:hypothetical protein
MHVKHANTSLDHGRHVLRASADDLEAEIRHASVLLLAFFMTRLRQWFSTFSVDKTVDSWWTGNRRSSWNGTLC